MRSSDRSARIMDQVVDIGQPQVAVGHQTGTARVESVSPDGCDSVVVRRLRERSRTRQKACSAVPVRKG